MMHRRLKPGRKLAGRERPDGGESQRAAWLEEKGIYCGGNLILLGHTRVRVMYRAGLFAPVGPRSKPQKKRAVLQRRTR